MSAAPPQTSGLDVSGWQQRRASFTDADRVAAAKALVAHMESRSHLERYLTAARGMLARFEKEAANG